MYAQQNVQQNKTASGAAAEAEKKTKRARTEVKVEHPTIRYSDLGGIEPILKDLRELVERPFRFPRVYQHLGVDLPRGILLHGPPGCGKTGLAMAIAGELGVAMLRVAAPELVAGMSGESESRVRELFAQARKAAPCILFIDEIDAITPKRESASREMERRIVAQLLSSMDDLSNTSAEQPVNDFVFVIGATNRPDSIDPALRRAGRFDREIRMGIPDEAARLKILEVVAAKLTKSPELDLAQIARNSPGYVGADLKSLVREAANIAISRIFDNQISTTNTPNTPNALESPENENGIEIASMGECWVEQGDFEKALKKVQPSAKREGFAVVPEVTWEDVGALYRVRDELRLAVVEPMRHPELFAAMGISTPAGVLLYGPPGCGKTLLAKAVANETHSNFLSVKGPELLNKYLGESERAIRQLFERARASAPCVVFFDELDSLCPPRTSDSDSSSTSRIVNQLLTELDGLEGRKGVYILAATNRPDMLDPAMTRPGRLDRMLYVGLPDATERLDILHTVSRNTPLSPDVDLPMVAELCEGYSGADLSALIRESSMCAIKEIMLQTTTSVGSESRCVEMRHVQEALGKIKPSVKSK